MKTINGELKLTVAEVAQRHSLTRQGAYKRVSGGFYTHSDGRSGCHRINGHWYVDMDAAEYYEKTVEAGYAGRMSIKFSKVHDDNQTVDNPLKFALSQLRKGLGTIGVNSIGREAIYFGQSRCLKLDYGDVIEAISNEHLIAWHSDVRWHYYRAMPQRGYGNETKE